MRSRGGTVNCSPQRAGIAVESGERGCGDIITTLTMAIGQP
ncbi:MAG: hypothetical protein ACM309_10410 [Bacillota bacterium]